MAKSMKPGGGGRFAKLKGQLAKKGISNPGALAAKIGREKYGKEKFQSMAAKGRKRAAHHDGMEHHSSNMPHDGGKTKKHIEHVGNLNFHERHSTHEHTHEKHAEKMKHV